MKALWLIVLCSGLVACCTITSSIVDTHGKATDVVDEVPSQEVTASPDVSIPVSVVPGVPKI